MDISEVFKGLRMLVVDDSLFNLLIVKQFLERWGIEADTADNGREALRMAGKKHYDVILMDLQMPEMDGFLTTIQIRNLAGGYYSHIPIIALTASPEDHIRESLEAAQLTDYIAKPITSEGLFLKIAKYVADTQE